jgi:hypothetical protein
VLGTKAPANDAVPRRSAPSAVASDSACHAGGRGFESRRSRKSPCKLASFVAALGANDRRPTGSRSLRLPFADAWAVAPGGRTLALAVHRNPVNEPNSLNLVTLPSLRWRPGSVRLGADVSGLAWTSPHQVVALVGKFLCCPAPLRLVVVNLKSRRVAGQERISGTVLHIARSARGLVLLTGPTDAIGPASLVVAHPRGVRATRLPSIRAGEVPGGGGISQWRLPVSRSNRPARRPTSPTRTAKSPRRNGVLLVSGSNLDDSEEQLASDPAGLELIDTRNWTAEILAPDADSFTVANRVLLVTGARWRGT